MSTYSSNYTDNTCLHIEKDTAVKLVKDWRSAVDNGEILGIVSTDTSKAFDSLLPVLLISKLKAYNFSEHAKEELNWGPSQVNGRI